MFEQIEIKLSHIYFSLLILSFLLLIFFNEEKILVPKWGALVGFTFLLLVAAGESWKAWSKSGMIINTTLGVGKGANDGFNPSGDLIMATKKGMPSFACIATGGFVFSGFAMNGSKNFIVCPPEYVQQVGGNLFVRAKLRRVRYEQLPGYIQNSLHQLPKFKEVIVSKRRNLWLGLTSSYFGTDTAENIKFEEEFIAKMSVENEYKHMLDEMTERKKGLEKPENHRVHIVTDEVE